MLTALWSATVFVRLISGSDAIWLDSAIDVLEHGRTLGWMAAITFVMFFAYGKRFEPTFAVLLASAIGVAVIYLAGFEFYVFGADQTPTGEAVRFNYIARVILSVSGGLLIENLFRNSGSEARWAVKTLCFGVGTILSYDFLLYAEAALFGRIDSDLFAARGFVNALAAPLVVLAAARSKKWPIDLHVSRKLVFHSATLLGAGGYLVVISGVSYYFTTTTAMWSSSVRIVFIAVAVLGLALFLASGTIQTRIRDFITRNFFSYKYDYRGEWLKFIDAISTSSSQLGIPDRIVRAIGNIVGSTAGALWVYRDEDHAYQPAANWNMGEVLPPDPNGASEGLSILETIVSQYQGAKAIVASGNEDRRNALKAISLGAYDFFAKPVDIDQLRLILERAWQLHVLEEDNRRLAQAHVGRIPGMIGTSPQISSIVSTIEKVATTDVSVLILGESGTGKELVAQALHHLSHRAAGPFVAVNCAAIPENLLESELFGYEKGAFTGANKQTLGKVEMARGGTLFMDEIGDMPLSLQAKMLRFLQSRAVQRLGGHEDVPVDVRFVSASNRDLGAMTQSGGFREDLYFRVNEVSVLVPPLRDRDGDAVLIATALLQRFAEAFKKPPLSFTQEAMDAIAQYPWPGNIRELENRVKRAVVLAKERTLGPVDLGLAAGASAEPLLTLKDARQKAELEAVRRAMAATGNNQSHAAKVLGVSRQTLYNLDLTYGIKTGPET